MKKTIKKVPDLASMAKIDKQIWIAEKNPCLNLRKMKYINKFLCQTSNSYRKIEKKKFINSAENTWFNQSTWRSFRKNQKPWTDQRIDT